jgi:hypothetical protein
MKNPRTQILPADSHALEMPSGTPLGLGILGAARFSAIRRVLEQATRAANAKANLHAAESAVAVALVNREVAREQLRNIDVICDEAAAQITEGARIASLRRQLETMELEDRVAEAEARREQIRARKGGDGSARKGGVVKDEYADFIDQLRRMPEVVSEAAKAKAQVIAEAGGEDKLSEAQRQMCEMFDAMTQSFMSKKAGDAAL